MRSGVGLPLFRKTALPISALFYPKNPLRNAATKLRDFTSQTKQFKVSAMRPTNINYRRFVMGKRHMTSRRRAQPDSYFVLWRSRVQVAARRPVTPTQIPHHLLQSKQ